MLKAFKNEILANASDVIVCISHLDADENENKMISQNDCCAERK